MKIGHFSKFMKLNIHLLLCSKRHYIDKIEYPPSPICGGKTPIWIDRNLISIPPKRLGVLAGNIYVCICLGFSNVIHKYIHWQYQKICALSYANRKYASQLHPLIIRISKNRKKYSQIILTKVGYCQNIEYGLFSFFFT